MRTSLSKVMLAVALVGLGCSDKTTDPVTSFESVLLGANEVPAVVSTAGATATFNLVGGASGTDSVSYTITITSPTATAVNRAHIHTGAAGAAGGVAVWLCTTAGVTGAPAGTPLCATNGTTNGVLVTGKMPVTAANITAMRAFGTYANVHTAANDGGEIRGQLRLVGQ